MRAAGRPGRSTARELDKRARPFIVAHFNASRNSAMLPLRMLLPGKSAFLPALLCAVAVTVSAQEDVLAIKSRAANQMLQAGRYTEAIKIYRELVAALPDNPGVRFNLGLALEKSGQPAAAVPELKQATRGPADLAPAWLLLGVASMPLGMTR